MNHNQKIPVLIITGTVGVGKSSVADTVFEILKEQSLPVALINLDELGYAFPKPKDDPFHMRLRLKNLAAIWKNYDEAGVKSIIIPFVIEDRADLDHFRKAIPGAQIFVVRLDAPLSVIEERIRRRPLGGSMEWHLKRAAELTGILDENQPQDVTIDTESKDIQTIVEEVIEQWQGLKEIGS